MAINKGIVDIKGKIWGLSFYKLNGKSVVRASYGPDKERIMSNSSYSRMRENMSEFGGASYIAKVFRTCFAGVINVFSESYVSARLTAIMKTVNKLSSGKRGERAFEFSLYKENLIGFEFNSLSPFDASFLYSDYI